MNGTALPGLSSAEVQEGTRLGQVNRVPRSSAKESPPTAGGGPY